MAQYPGGSVTTCIIIRHVTAYRTLDPPGDTTPHVGRGRRDVTCVYLMIW